MNTRQAKYNAFRKLRSTSIHDHDNGSVSVKFYDTHIVELNDETITLNTGGWYTPITKNRMNRASDLFGLGYHVFQKDNAWYCTKGDDIYEFNPGRQKAMFSRKAHCILIDR